MGVTFAINSKFNSTRQDAIDRDQTTSYASEYFNIAHATLDGKNLKLHVKPNPAGTKPKLDKFSLKVKKDDEPKTKPEEDVAKDVEQSQDLAKNTSEQNLQE